MREAVIHESAPVFREINPVVKEEVIVHEPVVHNTGNIVEHHTRHASTPVKVIPEHRPEVVREVVAPVHHKSAPILETEIEHNLRCHEDPTYIHDVNFKNCDCLNAAAVPGAPIAFAEITDEERKYTGVFPWWLFPLILLGLLLIGILLCCTMRKKRQKEEVVVEKKREFSIQREVREQDEQEIEAEIERQLVERRSASMAKRHSEGQKEGYEQRQTYSSQAQGQTEVSPTSSKKIIKKRVTKMMRHGEVVGQREEILDEEGNVLKSQIVNQEFFAGA